MKIDWLNAEIQAVAAGCRDKTMIHRQETRALMDDIDQGLTCWTPESNTSEEIWQMYDVSRFAGQEYLERNGLRRCHIRKSKAEKLKKGFDACRRLQDPDDECLDIIGDGVASRMINGAELSKRAIEGYSRSVAYRSPWESITPMMCYWGDGDVCVIAGMSSTGKTNIALQMTAFNGIETLYFGVDMSDKGIAKRLWEINWYRDAQRVYGDVMDSQQIRAICEKDFRAAVEAKQVPVIDNIQVWDSDYMSIAQIEFEARALLRVKKYGALIIDYATRLDVSGEKDVWRAEQKAMRDIKGMAKRLHIPVLALSQFNKEAKPYEKPQYSWLSGSSELFCSADTVLALWADKSNPNVVNVSDDLKNRDAGCHGDVALKKYGLWLTDGGQQW